jgi:NAD(P)-dependent dehydrogenase (short-subunit alcohol dehydrogenase family)
MPPCACGTMQGGVNSDRNAAMSQNDRIALVTGAGSGIGRGCGLALLAAGWHVVFSGRGLDALNSAIESAGAAAERAVAIRCDVSREESVAELFRQIRDRFGRLDLLFNNAGTSSRSALPDELAASAWRQAVDTNLNGAFFCLAAAFKLMREQTPRGGRIINNGSISAHVPRPKSIAYAATKHAVTGLTRAAALDGRAFDIAVGQIDIGNVESDMTARMTSGVPQADGSLKPEARMQLSAVTETFMAMVNLPLSANVLFMTVMATQMPFVGRG